MIVHSAHNKTFEFTKPLVMAIVNATPDSFSDGGEVSDDEHLQQRIKQIIDKGADCIDVGGESTRPGHEPVDESEEISRVTRVVQAIRSQSEIPISIDTQKAAVAEAAIEAGADFINDISSLTDAHMVDVVRKRGCSVVLMRNKSLKEPIAHSAKDQIEDMVARALESGIEKDKIIIDPGLGFGDLAQQDFSALPGGNVAANLELVDEIAAYSAGLPVLIGASRKRFIGELTGVENAVNRVAGSVAIAMVALMRGAEVLRVHDVAATVQARDTLVK